ncbi:MAG: hypothetical protein ACKVS8_10600 [Phycisphaerales bacterium]
MPDHPIVPIVDRALRDLRAWLDSNTWIGRERELVSLFAFGHLVPLVSPRSVLRSAAQIAIEVGVKQTLLADPTQARRKEYVCKDLVIWPGAFMTCWNGAGEPEQVPLAILEWKRGGYRTPLSPRKPFSHADHDQKWLMAYTKRFPGCVGYSVALDRTTAGERLRVAKIVGGIMGPSEPLGRDPTTV